VGASPRFRTLERRAITASAFCWLASNSSMCGVHGKHCMRSAREAGREADQGQLPKTAAFKGDLGHSLSSWESRSSAGWGRCQAKAKPGQRGVARTDRHRPAQKQKKKKTKVAPLGPDDIIINQPGRCQPRIPVNGWPHGPWKSTRVVDQRCCEPPPAAPAFPHST
jgi:hypothetical protein